MKAGEGTSDVVQYHPTPNPSNEEEHSGVVEAEVSPPKETQRFPMKFLGFKPLVTRQELDEGLQHYNETLRSAAFKLHMLIKSGRYNKDQALQSRTILLGGLYSAQDPGDTNVPQNWPKATYTPRHLFGSAD